MLPAVEPRLLLGVKSNHFTNQLKLNQACVELANRKRLTLISVGIYKHWRYEPHTGVDVSCVWHYELGGGRVRVESTIVWVIGKVGLGLVLILIIAIVVVVLVLLRRHRSSVLVLDQCWRQWRWRRRWWSRVASARRGAQLLLLLLLMHLVVHHVVGGCEAVERLHVVAWYGYAQVGFLEILRCIEIVYRVHLLLKHVLRLRLVEHSVLRWMHTIPNHLVNKV